MESNKNILEALQMQPLSEEEKKTRHILGRLWGPIATTKEKTRNGRGYNMELWKKALADEIFCEKVANKSLFLELGHPVDREETDMQLVCACIPELPKIVDGDLYAYVDILDTKNGRLLKTLCDYGFVPGISSRGSGDVMANDDVDPETFFLDTWDIVQLPAVKKARLTVCESLNRHKSLTKALCEAYASADETTKQEVKDTLESLGLNDIDIDMPNGEVRWLPADDIGHSIPTNDLLEETEEIEAHSEDDDAIEPEEQDSPENAPEDEADFNNVTEEANEDETTDEDNENEDSEVETGDLTVGDLIKHLQDFEEDAIIEFAPISLENEEITITELTLDDSLEENKILINLDYDLSETDDNINSNTEAEESEEDKDEPETAEEDENAEDDSDEVIDDEEDEVVESIKTLVRQKEALEEKVLNLKNRKTVSDAKIRELTEELEKYKAGFMRVSEMASKATKLQKEAKSLTEQLKSKEAKLQTLEAQAHKQKLITESADNSKRKAKDLQERLITVQNEAEAAENELKTRLAEAQQKVKTREAAAKNYKQKYLKVVEHYIASKASMLGVSTKDISSKLQENFTIEDVDHICDTLLETGRPTFNFGIGAQSSSRAVMKESIAKPKQSEYGYEIDDDLLELAGLKSI